MLKSDCDNQILIILSFMNWCWITCLFYSFHRDKHPHTKTEIDRTIHSDDNFLNNWNAENSYDCFFFAFSQQVTVSTHWKTNNLTNTYWQTSLDGLSAQQFRLFLHCGVFTGIHIHTLRCKEKNDRILPHITLWVNCSTFLIVFPLSSVDRYTEMQRRRPPHIVTYRVMG